MILLISPWWLIPAFISGCVTTIVALAIFGAADFDMPKPKWGEDPDDKPMKIYHSQEAVKALDGRLTNLNVPLDELEIGN